MNQAEIDIFSEFKTNLASMELMESLNLLEQDVNNANLDIIKFERFQSFANTVRILDENEPGLFSAAELSSCADAMLGLVFATVGLAGGCSPPAMGASVGFFCYVAAAKYVRASVVVDKNCRQPSRR